MIYYSIFKAGFVKRIALLFPARMLNFFYTLRASRQIMKQEEQHMIRRNDERITDIREKHLGGKGKITIRHILNDNAELYDKGRVFCHTTLEPGASIGYHIHTGEFETYYIVSGTAKFCDNMEDVILHAGDVAYTPDGEGHGIENIGDEPLELIALIIFK